LKRHIDPQPGPDEYRGGGVRARLSRLAQEYVEDEAEAGRKRADERNRNG
jgi:hypothetical protein